MDLVGTTNRRVLVVDDAMLSRRIAAVILESGGHRVDEAENGAEAVEAVRAIDYDLVLMDLAMPVMDGYAASATIRGLTAGRPRSVPVVAMSGSAGDPARREACGLTALVVKPFDPRRLLADVERWTAPAHEDETEAPIWDRAAFREIAQRIGERRAEEALAVFATGLRRTLGRCRTMSSDPSSIRREAHDLTSTAGMLGFAQLSAASRTVIMAEPAAELAEPIGRLVRAAERVLDGLPAIRQAALA